MQELDTFRFNFGELESQTTSKMETLKSQVVSYEAQLKEKQTEIDDLVEKSKALKKKLKKEKDLREQLEATVDSN